MLGISIVVTYYKGEKFIEQCIDSLINSYNASSHLLNYEIIIVIDSMEDAFHMESLLKEKYENGHLIIIKNENNIGVAASRNVGLEKIRNEFYTVVDQDDFVNKNYFSVLEDKLDINIPVHMINGVIRYINENIEVPIYTFKPKFQFKNLLLKDTFIYTPGLVIFNSKFIKSESLFLDASTKYKGCDDWAAYLNILVSNKNEIRNKFIRCNLFTYCLHDENYSHNKMEMIQSSTAVLNYFKGNPSINKHQKKLVDIALDMQDFYIAKDVQMISKGRLLVLFPRQFFRQYILAIFSIDNANKILLKIKYFILKSFKQ